MRQVAFLIPIRFFSVQGTAEWRTAVADIKYREGNVQSLQYEMLSSCAAEEESTTSPDFLVAKRRPTVQRLSALADARTTGRAYSRHANASASFASIFTTPNQPLSQRTQTLI